MNDKTSLWVILIKIFNTGVKVYTDSHYFSLSLNKLNNLLDVLLFKIKEINIKGDSNFLISFVLIFNWHDLPRGNSFDSTIISGVK